MLALILGKILELLAATGVFIPIAMLTEWLWPRAAARPVTRLKGLVFWAVYFLIAGTILGIEARLLPLMRPLLIVKQAPIVFVAAPILAALLSDFLYYWTHRLQHTPPLWRFHAVHHSIRDMNAANSAHHWTEELVHIPLIGLPMAFLVKLDLASAPICAGLVTLQTYLIHANTRLNAGPLAFLLVDNRFHRIHHSLEAHHIGHNFGVFTTLWDRLFGTAYLPKGDEWPAVGLDDRSEINGVGEYLFRPFTSRGGASPTAADSN